MKNQFKTLEAMVKAGEADTVVHRWAYGEIKALRWTNETLRKKWIASEEERAKIKSEYLKLKDLYNELNTRYNEMKSVFDVIAKNER